MKRLYIFIFFLVLLLMAGAFLIHFGYKLRPLTNPRLQQRLGPQGVNPYPHPIA